MNQVNVIPAEAEIQSFKHFFKVETRLNKAGMTKITYYRQVPYRCLLCRGNWWQMLRTLRPGGDWEHPSTERELRMNAGKSGSHHKFHTGLIISGDQINISRFNTGKGRGAAGYNL